jgi:uncharacterized protein with von Willebrand factor type A (vWA) domain
MQVQDCVKIITDTSDEIEKDLNSWLQSPMRHRKMKVISISISQSITPDGQTTVIAAVFYQQPS